MSNRPLVFVSGLTLGDYLLWNWSLNSNHDVLALVSGLTLPPLGVACLWLLVLGVMRMIARYGRLRSRRAGTRRGAMGRSVAAPGSPGGLAEAQSSTAAERSSDKLAA